MNVRSLASRVTRARTVTPRRPRLVLVLHRWTRGVERWRSSYATATEALAVYRIIYVMFVLLVQGAPSYRWLGAVPDALYRPPAVSFASLFDGFAAGYVLTALTVLVCVLYVAVLFGYHTRWSSLALAGALLVGNSFTYSFGKVNHDELFIMLIPAVMAFSTWGNALSLDHRAGRNGAGSSSWPVAILALLLGFAMLTAGVPKLTGGWLDPSTQAVRGHFVERVYALDIDGYAAPFLARATVPTLLWELLDQAAVLFELTFVLAVFRRTLFRAYLGLAVVFHLANLLVLNIAFTSNLVLYLLYVDWKPVLAWLHRRGVSRVLEMFASFRVFLGVQAVAVGFVVLRMLLGTAGGENALRAAANQDVPGVFSPWNGVEALAGVRVDLNLGLLLVAVAAVIWYAGQAVVGPVRRDHRASRVAVSRIRASQRADVDDWSVRASHDDDERSAAWNRDDAQRREAP